MNIRRKTFNEITGQPRLQKALAFVILLKRNVKRDSTIKNFTINKLRKISGLSATTIKKYIPIAEMQGWIHYSGNKCQHLVVSKLYSGTGGRNVNIDKFCFDSFMDVYNSIRSFLALLLQARKDFIKRTLQIVADPKRGDDYVAARNTMKRLVRKGIIRDVYTKYKELGLSYKRIAKELGNCAKTAFKVMKYAITKEWVAKHHHQEQVFTPNIFYYPVEGYMFSTKNNLYRIHANSYDITAGIISW